MSTPRNSSSQPGTPDADARKVSARLLPLGADLDDAPFWTEVEAFSRIPQTIVDEHYGKYVAVYGGSIVDADADEGELALRFYRTFGYVPVYIHKVGTEDGLIDADDR